MSLCAVTKVRVPAGWLSPWGHCQGTSWLRDQSRALLTLQGAADGGMGLLHVSVLPPVAMELGKPGRGVSGTGVHRNGGFKAPEGREEGQTDSVTLLRCSLHKQRSKPSDI